MSDSREREIDEFEDVLNEVRGKVKKSDQRTEQLVDWAEEKDRRIERVIEDIDMVQRRLTKS